MYWRISYKLLKLILKYKKNIEIKCIITSWFVKLWITNHTYVRPPYRYDWSLPWTGKQRNSLTIWKLHQHRKRTRRRAKKESYRGTILGHFSSHRVRNQRCEQHWNDSCKLKKFQLKEVSLLHCWGSTHPIKNSG